MLSQEPRDSARVGWLESIGAMYHTTDDLELRRAGATLGALDLIIEATGVPSVIFSAMQALARNGVLALLGISGGNRDLTIPAAQINLELVLGSQYTELAETRD